MLRVLSLGAGVQSSTLLLMSELGELPRLDAAIFADTGAEPSYVYAWLEWLMAQVTIPVYRVATGTLDADVLASLGDGGSGGGGWPNRPAPILRA